MDRMRSVVLDTIHDIALILREFDPGGCTHDCPQDEYINEVIEIWTTMKWSLAADHDGVTLLGWIIEQMMLRSFEGFSTRNREMYEQIARACINVRDANRESYLKEFKVQA